MVQSIEQLCLFQGVEQSPRDVAREAVLELSALLECDKVPSDNSSDRSHLTSEGELSRILEASQSVSIDDLNQTSLDIAAFFADDEKESLSGVNLAPAPSEIVSQLLNYVRDRHHLTRRAHFYAFIKEIDARLAHDLRVLRNTVVHGPASEADRQRESSGRSFLSRLAGFLGLSTGAADKEFRTLTNRDVEEIWNSLALVEQSNDCESGSIWELLLNCLVELVGGHISGRVVSQRECLPYPDQFLEDVVLYGRWSGTPPPADVAARYRASSYIPSHRRNCATFFGSGRRGDLPFGFLTSVAKESRS